MAAPRTVHGARAVVRIAGPGANSGQPVGIFSSFSYGLALDVQGVPILGRYTVAETVYTGAEPVRCTGLGWRVVGAGPHVSVKFPKIQDLLSHEYIQIDILDRQTDEVIAIIKDTRPETYNTGVQAKQLSEVTHTFIGILVDDESTVNSESPGAPDLPPTV